MEAAIREPKHPGPGPLPVRVGQVGRIFQGAASENRRKDLYYRDKNVPRSDSFTGQAPRRKSGENACNRSRDNAY